MSNNNQLDKEVALRPNATLVVLGDTVVTVTEDIKPGALVCYQSGEELLALTALTAVPIYHKMSISPKTKGQEVIKYGEKIGVALRNFQAGEHVHEHNLASRLED